MNVTPKQLLIGGAIIGGIAAVWTLYDKIAGALDSIGKAGADLVPQGVIDAIAGPKVQTTASVVLSNGMVVSFNTIVAQGGSLKHISGDIYEFTYNGFRYRMVPPRRADGHYNAVRA